MISNFFVIYFYHSLIIINNELLITFYISIKLSIINL